MQKIFKKSLALAVSAALCLTAFIGCLTVNAAGEASNPSYVVEDVTGAPGDTVKIVVKGSNLTKICGQLLDVKLGNGLTFVKAYNAKGELLPISDPVGDGDYNLINGSDGSTIVRFVEIINFRDETPTENFDLTIEATIPEEAAAGTTYDVTLDGQFANIKEEWVVVDIKNGVVTVESGEPTEPVYDASLKINGKNGLFESDYSLLYYIPATLPDGWYISVKMASYNGNERLEDVEIKLTENDVYDTVNMAGSDYHRVALKGIAAKEVANEIVATLHKVVDGVDYYGDSLNYNLVTYAETRIAANQPKEVAALAAFLNYAAATQERFNYNTQNLANASLTDEQKEIKPASEITDETRDDNYITIDNPSANLRGFAPSYKDKMTLVTMFDAPEEYISSGAKIKYEYVSNTIEKVEYVNLSEGKPFPDAEGVLQVSFTGIAIKDVRTPVLVTIVDSEGNAISNTRRYSFEVYAASRGEGTPDYEPARAMIAFGDWFKEFKEN